MSISPSRRLIEGPGGARHLEPLIMQVMLILIEAKDKVVTRTQLFEQCWGGTYVGDDSLNRAIAKLRRAATEAAPGLIEIETIPRTGYRLVTSSTDTSPRQEPAQNPTGPNVDVSRRLMIGTAAAAGIAATGIGLRALLQSRSTDRFDALMDQGDQAVRTGFTFEQFRARPSEFLAAIALYKEAVQHRPDSAKAWGLLAYYSAAAEGAGEAGPTPTIADAELAIRRALQLDPAEPNARLALYLLQGRMLEWAARDRYLRSILATDPNNLLAMAELMPLLQAAGMTRESWTWNERVLSASPFARSFLVTRALKLWILGKVSQADLVIDRVRSLWPDFDFGTYARFNIFALTDRPRAAMALLDSASAAIRKRYAHPFFRAALTAIDTRNPSKIEAARASCIELVGKSPPVVNDVVMFLCAMGLEETAFEVTEGFVLWRGKIVSQNQANGKMIDDYNRRMTQWLFTPPVAIMRADPRFLELCGEFGLTDYWNERKVRPDYQRHG